MLVFNLTFVQNGTAEEADQDIESAFRHDEIMREFGLDPAMHERPFVTAEQASYRHKGSYDLDAMADLERELARLGAA